MRHALIWSLITSHVQTLSHSPLCEVCSVASLFSPGQKIPNCEVHAGE